MDGGIEATVAAYLLKKQGYNCIGVTVIFHEDDSDFDQLISPCLPDDLENIKNICKGLEIPFYATNASERYFDEVVDKMISARLTGKRYEPMVDRAVVIVETLMEKIGPLQAKAVATGHYCKILKNQTTGMLNLYAANDLAEDDSYYLSKLPYKYLEYLHLPLAELREQEVKKISSLIPVNFQLDKEYRREKRLNFMMRESLVPLIEKYSAASLRKDGIVLNYNDSSTVGDHLGIHQFYVGQEKIPLKNNIPTDKESQVLRIVPSQGTVLMEKTHRLSFSHVYLHQFMTEKNLNRSLPIVCYAMLGPRREMLKCLVTFKNNDCVLLDFSKEIEGICVRGQYVVLYNKKGIGARVIGGGVVRVSGYYDDQSKWRVLPKTKEEEEELQDESKPKKKDLGF